MWFNAFRALSVLACMAPGLWLGFEWSAGELGIDPLARLLRFSGLSAISLLLVTLSVTPLRRLSVAVARAFEARFGRRLSDWNKLIRLRRQFGLFAFFYASLHIGLYLWLDIGFSAHEFAHDVLERPFISLGLLTYLMLVPLAASSTRSAMRALGRRWQALHTLVYPAAIAAVLHDAVHTKLGQPLPLWTAGLLALLLGARLVSWRLGDRTPSGEIAPRGREAVSPSTAVAPPSSRCSPPSAACASAPRTAAPRRSWRPWSRPG